MSRSKKLFIFFIAWVMFSPINIYSAVISPQTSQESRFRVNNQCSETLWIQQDYKNTSQDPVVVKIEPGMAYDYNIPEQGLASTRFWAKSGCNEHGYQCQVGESTSVPEAFKNGWQKAPFAPDVNSKFEATWGCANSIYNHAPNQCALNPSSTNGAHLNNETWWNGSAVDGYTFPYAINVTNHQNSCLDLHSSKVLTEPGVDCGGLTPSMCPSAANLSTEGKYNIINGVDVTRINLQWLNPVSKKPVGCFSPCAKLTTAQGSDDGSQAGGLKSVLGGISPESVEAQMYCCPTPPISSGQCSAGPAARNAYSQSIAQQRCNSYTYAYDDAKGLARCGSQAKFEVVFCPKNTTQPQEVSMNVILPESIKASYNNIQLNSGQSITIQNGSNLYSDSSSCSFNVDDNLQVTINSGVLCQNLIIDNHAKSITLTATKPPISDANYQMQVNFNTAVGITAMVNNMRVNNAQLLNSKDFTKDSVLKAYQANKSATCALTLTLSTVERGTGTLCDRLNIVKESTGKVHVYLPSDIPNMTGTDKPPSQYIHFGMTNSMHATFANQTMTNGTKLLITDLNNANQVTLTAYQYPNQASCIFSNINQQLAIIQNSGLLCDGGLSIVKNNQGDYYIGLPDPLPKLSDDGGDKFKVQLGIASGMKITVNSLTTAWNSSNKSILLNNGNNDFLIIGNNGSRRHCNIMQNNGQLQISATAGCVGVVNHADVIYFPYF